MSEEGKEEVVRNFTSEEKGKQRAQTPLSEKEIKEADSDSEYLNKLYNPATGEIDNNPNGWDLNIMT